MDKKKKPYVKPDILFENFVTGEITGTPEMVAQFMKEVEGLKEKSPLQDYPVGEMGIPCYAPKG